MLVVWRNKRRSVLSGKTDQTHTRHLNEIDRERGIGSRHSQKDLTRIFGKGDETLSTLVLRSVSCNLTLLSHYGKFRPAEVPDACLTLHTGIGAGVIKGIFVGGVDRRWEFFVAGDPIRQMSDAGEEAGPGELVLSPEAYACIASLCSCKVRKTPSGQIKVFQVSDAPRIFKSTVPQLVDDEALEPILQQAFIPHAVQLQLDAGMSSSWLAEYRRVFIMFVMLPDVSSCLVLTPSFPVSLPHSLTRFSLVLLPAPACSRVASMFGHAPSLACLPFSSRPFTFRL